MPTLVDYSGEDELCNGKSFHPGSIGSSVFFHTESQLDFYFPPLKRSRYGNESMVEIKSSIDSLPDECLFEILRRLSGPERSACACVSKHWLTLLSSIHKAELRPKASPRANNDTDVAMEDDNGADLEDDGDLARCLEGKKATDIRLAAIAVGTANRGGLGKLTIRGNNSTRGITDFGLLAIGHGCPSLRSLSIWNVSSIRDEGLFEIANGCHMLEKLDFSHCSSISNKGLIAVAENCPNLTTLSVESCPNIGNASLEAIARCCPKLESVSIEDCPLVGDRGIVSLFASASSSLAKLKLRGLSISDLSLVVIGRYGKSLTHLTLSNLRNMGEKGFWIMGNACGLNSLVFLSINSCLGLTDSSLEAVGNGCPTLKQFILRKSCFLSDNGLVAFSRSLTSLESLQLEECNRITQTGFFFALSCCRSKLRSLSMVKCMGFRDMAMGITLQNPCRSLRSLSIKNCPGFGSASLAILGKVCPELRHVDLSGLYGLTDDGVLSFLGSSKAGFVKLNLSGCINLSDESVLGIAKLHGGSIKMLNLDGCRRITDASLLAIAESCISLDDLDLSCSAITDVGMAALSSMAQPNLQILSLSGCSGISNKSLPFLIKLGKRLVGLNLKNCSSISSTTMDLLMGNLWKCDILA